MCRIIQFKNEKADRLRAEMLENSRRIDEIGDEIEALCKRADILKENGGEPDDEIVMRTFSLLAESNRNRIRNEEILKELGRGDIVDRITEIREEAVSRAKHDFYKEKYGMEEVR